jgi:hypothetical protein
MNSGISSSSSNPTPHQARSHIAPPSHPILSHHIPPDPHPCPPHIRAQATHTSGQNLIPIPIPMPSPSQSPSHPPSKSQI